MLWLWFSILSIHNRFSDQLIFVNIAAYVYYFIVIMQIEINTSMSLMITMRYNEQYARCIIFQCHKHICYIYTSNHLMVSCHSCHNTSLRSWLARFAGRFWPAGNAGHHERALAAPCAPAQRWRMGPILWFLLGFVVTS